MSITAEQSAGWYEARGRALGEQADDTDRCSHCQHPTLADELIDLDGQEVCVACLIDLTGDDPYAPDNARDVGSATTAAVLLGLIFAGLVFLAVLHAGQQAMCALHADEPLRYCDSYSATTPEETPDR